MAACLLFVTACGGNHSVSPWGGGEAPPPSVLIQASDLGAQLQIIDQETAARGLTVVTELRGNLPRGGGEVVARGYRGVDRLGRPITAVRVVSSRGLVLTLGPRSLRDLDHFRATELLAHPLLGDVPLDDDDIQRASLGDLNGDGSLDVVLRSEAGTLEVWSLRAFSATPYPIELTTLPTLALDIEPGSGLSLGGRPQPVETDQLQPDLLEIATFESGRYTGQSAAARAYHARRARELTTESRSPSTEPTAPDETTRLRRAIERAWYTLLAGRPRTEVLTALDKERVSSEHEGVFAAYRTRIARMGSRSAKTTTEKTPTGQGAETPARR
ncbi:VCBS repeat-containing protein [Chondromyces crocatus]|uniref:VCBS repeat-containing protein n=1 Tax=Chondromyces crocatus TaxID=52 RepID=UPI0012E0E5F1|nr:VCBS repeat-containing protein [Chondromyces crocatus]